MHLKKHRIGSVYQPALCQVGWNIDVYPLLAIVDETQEVSERDVDRQLGLEHQLPEVRDLGRPPDVLKVHLEHEGVNRGTLMKSLGTLTSHFNSSL